MNTDRVALSEPRIAIPTTQRVERDTVPRQVAIEMLCRPGVRMTNKERKLFMQSLETHYESTLPSRENRRQQILANRLKGRKWAQLLKWNRRCIATRALVQSAYIIGKRRLEKLSEKTGKPSEQDMLAILVLQRQMAALELKAAELDMAWEAVTDEMERRQKICKAKKTC